MRRHGAVALRRRAMVEKMIVKQMHVARGGRLLFLTDFIRQTSAAMKRYEYKR